MDCQEMADEQEPPEAQYESTLRQVNVRLPRVIYDAFNYAAVGRETSMPRLLEGIVTDWVIANSDEITQSAAVASERAQALVAALGDLVTRRASLRDDE
jgi:hypothetical protein